MKIIQTDLENLELDPENARLHSKSSIKALAKSLEMFGQRKPVVVTKEGRVVAGNGTVAAARELGWSKIATVPIPDDWDEVTIKAFALADNRTAELSDWNTEILAEQLFDLEAVEFPIEWLSFNLPKPPEEKELTEFPSFDAEKESEYKCPKCSYEWDGTPR